MADTAIEWTQRSWNPIVGCSLESPGCTNCYAMRMARRLEMMGTVAHYAGLTQQTKAGPVWTGKLALAPQHVLLEPLRRRKPTTWFVNSMGDLFHEDVPDEWIDRVFAVMALCPQHIFQVLTKRAARMRNYLNQAELPRTVANTSVDLPYPDELVRIPSWPLRNVWLGVSAEDQKRANERVPDLLDTPAAIRFVSAEPLLGPIDFESLLYEDWLRLDALSGLHFDGEGAVDGVYGNPDPSLDWIIVGGESGPKARPMHPDWARSIRDQCAAAGTAFFLKQNGAWAACQSNDGEWPTDADGFIRLRRDGTRGADGWPMQRLTKKAAGRLLDGVEHNAMPEVRHG